MKVIAARLVGRDRRGRARGHGDVRGSSPSTVAVFVKPPASTWDWVTVVVAEHDIVAPGASDRRRGGRARDRREADHGVRDADAVER